LTAAHSQHTIGAPVMSSRRAPACDDADFLFKIVLIGESGVRKTNLLPRFLGGPFAPDSGGMASAEFGSALVTIGGKRVRAQIWDTAGQERYRAIATAYYRGAVGAMLVYDLTPAPSFRALARWLAELRTADPRIVAMLVGNRCDMGAMRVVSAAEAATFASAQNLICGETSAN
jgi:small GTP-binding protein